MKYMLFTYRDPTVALSPQQRATVPGLVEAWCDEMDARGVRLQGQVLAALDDAVVIRERQGALSVTRGPLSEATLQIAGFNILECASLDEGIEVAAANPGAAFVTLELRPIAE
jgi:hypothetical protein